MVLSDFMMICAEVMLHAARCVVFVIRPIMFFVTMLLDSQPGENRYGPNPKIG